MAVKTNRAPAGTSNADESQVVKAVYQAFRSEGYSDQDAFNLSAQALNNSFDKKHPDPVGFVRRGLM